MRGRKPKPTRQKILEGNPGKRPLPVDEPQLPTAAADFDAPPPALEHHPHAQAEWSRLAPLLRQAAQITAADRSALLAVCLEWDRYLTAMSEVQKLGLVVQTKTGYPMANPYLPIATKALAACNKLWPELGLTPSSRARVKTTPPAGPDDPFAEFDLPIAPTPTRPQ